MALTVQRDLDGLVTGLTAWLADREGAPVTVDHVVRPTEGWSSETVLLHTSAGEVAVRLAPVGDGIFPTYDLGLQARAMTAAAGSGVAVPVPVEVVSDTSWVGDPFLVMPLVDGHVPGELAAFDPWVTDLRPDRRRSLHEAVTDALVTLHGADTAGLDLPRRDIEVELGWWSDYLAWADLGVPVLDEAHRWCALNRPASEPPGALLWGDVRLGNVVFTGDGDVAAVLDWEMATIGAPEHDLGWWWGLEAMQDELVGGRPDWMPPIEELRARYEAAVGRELVDLDWYETFALFRSTAILTRIGRLQERAGVPTRMPVPDNPVLDHLTARIARRT